MKIVFGTTNERKIDDLKNLIEILNLDIEVLSLKDINYQEEIEETGLSLSDNSLIKAGAIYKYLKTLNLNYIIITDDSGLFVDSLNGEPGIYTGRYADLDIQKNPNLPKYQCVIKLLDKLKDIENRNAFYKCVVTCMFPDGSYFQETGESLGSISKEIIGVLNKPYFYSVFIDNKYQKAFSELRDEELQDTYRYKGLKKVLKKIK